MVHKRKQKCFTVADGSTAADASAGGSQLNAVTASEETASSRRRQKRQESRELTASASHDTENADVLRQWRQSVAQPQPREHMPWVEARYHIHSVIQNLRSQLGPIAEGSLIAHNDLQEWLQFVFLHIRTVLFDSEGLRGGPFQSIHGSVTARLTCLFADLCDYPDHGIKTQSAPEPLIRKLTSFSIQEMEVATQEKVVQPGLDIWRGKVVSARRKDYTSRNGLLGSLRIRSLEKPLCFTYFVYSDEEMQRGQEAQHGAVEIEFILDRAKSDVASDWWTCKRQT